MRPPKHTVWILYAISMIGSGVGFMTQILVSGFWSTAFAQDVTFFSVNLAFYFLSLGIGVQLCTLWKQPRVRDLLILVLLGAVWCGLSIPILRAAIYRFNEVTHLAVITVCIAGVLAGPVVPLTLRIGQKMHGLTLGRLFFLDYLSALAFTLAFTLILLIPLGYLRTALSVSVILVALTGILAVVLKERSRVYWGLLTLGIVGPMAFGMGTQRLTGISATDSPTKVLWAVQSHYQKIVLTERVPTSESLFPATTQHTLYLDGFTQFTSGSEQLYHFCLANVPATAAADSGRPIRNALILGGGDGLVARNLLAMAKVESITLVELDPKMIDLARHDERLRSYNLDALSDPRVKIVIEDAFTWARRAQGVFDLIVIDLPTPKNLALARLFSAEFYRWVTGLLHPKGFMSIQAGPYFDASPTPSLSLITASIARTVESTGLPAWIYHTPHDADAFVLTTPYAGFSMTEFSKKVGIHKNGPLAGVCTFDADLTIPKVKINTLNTLPLAHYALNWYRALASTGYFYFRGQHGVFLPD